MAFKRDRAYDVEDDFDLNDDEETTPVKPAKRGKQKKEKPAKKEKVPKGFFADDAFQPYTGKICSIKYFVFAIASLTCPLFLLFGGGLAKEARNYMIDSGDTEGVGFLAAGKAIRSIACWIWLFALLAITATAVFAVCSIAGLAAWM